MIRLTHTEISSYVGDVIPLKLYSDMYSLAGDGVKWSASGDAVTIRGFENDPELPFSDAVMVALCKVGVAEITAYHRGKRYTCTVNVRARRHFTSSVRNALINSKP